MAKVNYRHQKRQREEAQKKAQASKLVKRGRVPTDAPSGSPPGSLPPRSTSA